MKRIIICCLTILQLSLNAFNQDREVDWEALIVSPDSGYVYVSPSVDTVKYALINHGPDTVYPWDFQYTYVLIGNVILNPWVTEKLPQQMNPGDTLLQSYAMHMNFSITNDDIPLCVTSKVVGAGVDNILNEEEGHGNYTNNEHCIRVDHLSKSSSVDRRKKSTNWNFQSNPIERGSVGLLRVNEVDRVLVVNSIGETTEKRLTQGEKPMLTMDEPGLFWVTLLDENGNSLGTRKLMVY